MSPSRAVPEVIPAMATTLEASGIARVDLV